MSSSVKDAVRNGVPVMIITVVIMVVRSSHQTFFSSVIPLTCLSVFSDERPEKRERESVPRLLLGLLHVCSGDGALLPGQSAGPAEERGRQIRLDVQVLACSRPHQGKLMHLCYHFYK